MFIKIARKSYKISRIIRTLTIIFVFIFTFFQILVLSPSSVNETPPLELRSMLDRNEVLWDITSARNKIYEDQVPPSLGIPADKIPQYRLKNLRYISNHKGKKEWRLKAQEGRQFEEDGLTHALLAEAELFSDIPDEKPTLITGLEARYETVDRKLEIFGNAIATFPDGFIVKSDYMLYEPEKKIIFIPKKYEVFGIGITSDSKELTFKSFGMNYSMGTGEIHLLEKVETEIKPMEPKPEDSVTQIFSDQAILDRDKKIAHYSMFESSIKNKRFVRLIQPTMEVTSLRMKLNYSDKNKSLEKLYAYDEAVIKEYNAQKILVRRATCNEAQFDYHKNIVHLIGYPQVYQNQDTITGQLIIINRNNDTIRVEKSNAFNRGN